MEYSTQQQGFQSLEIIISLTLFALLFVAIFVLFGSTATESNGLLRQVKGNALVNEALDAVRVMSEQDFESMEAGQHGLVFNTDHWEFSGDTDVTDDTFFRTVTITDVASDEKDVSVEVYWSFWGRLIDRTAVTRVTNWQNVEVWGDWGTPIVVGSLDIGPQGEATGVVRSGNYAFLTAQTASGTRPSLFSIDISDPANPIIVDSYITGGSLFSLTLVADDYLYVVGDSEDLLIFDVSNPTSIQFLSSEYLGDEGIRIIKDGETVYLGTEAEIQMYDVSLPTSPTFLSRYSVGGEVNGLSVGGDYLYAATELNTQELLVLSISDLENPTFVSAYDVSGTLDGTAVRIDGMKLYLGTENNASTGTELLQFDATDPANIVLKNEVDLGGGVQEITTAGPYVYLATEASNLEFQIWQVGSGWILDYVTGINMAQVATGVTFDDNTIFISLRSNDAFQVVQPSP